MWELIVEFFLKHWGKASVGILIALAVLGGYLRYEYMTHEITTLTAKVAQYKTNEAGYQQRINAQNASILQYKKESDAAAQQLADAEKSAKQVGDKYDAEIQKLKAKHVPKTCSGAMDYLLKQAQEGGS